MAGGKEQVAVWERESENGIICERSSLSLPSLVPSGPSPPLANLRAPKGSPLPTLQCALC